MKKHAGSNETVQWGETQGQLFSKWGAYIHATSPKYTVCNDNLYFFNIKIKHFESWNDTLLYSLQLNSEDY